MTAVGYTAIPISWSSILSCGPASVYRLASASDTPARKVAAAAGQTHGQAARTGPALVAARALVAGREVVGQGDASLVRLAGLAVDEHLAGLRPGAAALRDRVARPARETHARAIAGARVVGAREILRLHVNRAVGILAAIAVAAAAQAEEDRQRKMGEAILTKFFEDMVRLMDKSQFISCVKISRDNTLCIAFNEYYAEYRKELRLQGDSIDDFKKSTIKDYIVKSPFFKPGKNRNELNARFDDDIKHVLKLNISQMPVHLRELFDKSIMDNYAENSI